MLLSKRLRNAGLIAMGFFGCSIVGLYAATASDTFEIDTVHSSVIFKIKHMGVSYTYGRFNDVTGTFAPGEKDGTNGSFQLEVKIGSIDTNNKARDKHLLNADFFDATKYPTAKFTSKSVKAAGDDEFDVTGDFTLHGVTKPLTVRVTKVGTAKGMQGEMRCGYDATLKIKRSDYGMDKMVGPISDEVTLMIGLEGTKK